MLKQVTIVKGNRADRFLASSVVQSDGRQLFVLWYDFDGREQLSAFDFPLALDVEPTDLGRSDGR